MSALAKRSAPTGLLEKLVPQARAETRIESCPADADDTVWADGLARLLAEPGASRSG